MLRSSPPPLRRALLAASIVLAPVQPARPATDLPASTELPSLLDLETALRLLHERGLDLLAAEAAVAGAEGDLAAAGAVANPTLGGTYGRSHYARACTDAGATVPCPALANPALSASLSDNAALSDALTGKRGLRQDVARSALAAARKGRDDAVRNLVAQVKTQFVAVVLARDAVAFAVEVAAAQARAVELSQARYQAGAISEADLARIETARLEADQAVDQAKAAWREAQVGLAFLLGVRGPVPEFDVVAGDLARASPPPALVAATRQGLLQQAFASRADVVAAQRQQERAEAALALARRQRIPDVSLSVAYAQQGLDNQAVAPPTWTLGLSVPLPIFHRQGGEIQRAEADLRTQRIALARAQATAVSDVETAWAGLQAARALTARMEGGLLERSKRALDLVTFQYQKGATTLLDLLDARRTWIATRLEYLQDVAAYWQAVFRLEQAAGVELR
jgi:cobalt-zinc-cadmium efflux system outer membrane protein